MENIAAKNYVESFEDPYQYPSKPSINQLSYMKLFQWLWIFSVQHILKCR